MIKEEFIKALDTYLARISALKQENIIEGYDILSSDEPDVFESLSPEEAKLIHDRMLYNIKEST